MFSQQAPNCIISMLRSCLEHKVFSWTKIKWGGFFYGNWITINTLCLKQRQLPKLRIIQRNPIPYGYPGSHRRRDKTKKTLCKWVYLSFLSSKAFDAFPYLIITRPLHLWEIHCSSISELRGLSFPIGTPTQTCNSLN